jgi:tetratricopeptide (TPR) repeat protein
MHLSVIVRSMARPSLAAALESIALQDCELEVLLVAASGPTHPPPPARCGPHTVRFVPGSALRPRPVAANAGLEQARGDWIGFLDDDDVFLPGHLRGLLGGVKEGTGVVYSYADAVFADGRHERFGQPFSLMQLYERNFIHLAASIVDRTLVGAGCRFDESLDIHEDWDFFLQCAQHAPFRFVSDARFQWNAEAGASGAAAGVNQDDQRFADFRDRVYNKWRPARDALIDGVVSLLGEAQARAARGELGGAETACQEALAASPNDAYALNLLAKLQHAGGRSGAARATLELATAVRPQDPGIATNLAQLCAQMGDVAAARQHIAAALAAEASFAPARQLADRLRATPVQR